MIKDAKALSMVESVEYLKGKDDAEIKGFIKKFSKLTPKEAKELGKKLKNLNLMKMDSKHVSKIIEFLPENNEELSKIFVGIGLDEEEEGKILDIVKEFK